MVYYKVVFDDRKPAKDNHYPIVIRITYNRKSTTFTTGVRIKKENWDEKNYQVSNNHSNYLSLNKKILEFYLKVQKAVLEIEDKEDFDFILLKEIINGKQKPIEIKKVDFKTFADQLIDDMHSINKAGNAIVYKTATNRFMGFVDKPNIQFADITYTLLDGFRRKLIKDNVKTNSISNYFRTIRAIYNKAVRAKIIDRSHYPFLDISIKVEKTAKRAISLEEIKAIIKLNLKEYSQEWHARNYFILSFALRGASFTDIAYLKFENIRKGYIVYKRRKTGKELRVKIFPLTQQLINIYKSNTKYLFPVLPENIIEDSLKAKNILFQWIKTSNKYLKRIGDDCNLQEDITTYVTRHSFATIAKKKLGYSNEVIAECLGHEYGNKITNTYLDSYDQSLIDEVNERMINLIK